MVNELALKDAVVRQGKGNTSIGKDLKEYKFRQVGN
jgi:hypothetical protein